MFEVPEQYILSTDPGVILVFSFNFLIVVLSIIFLTNLPKLLSFCVFSVQLVMASGGWGFINQHQTPISRLVIVNFWN